MKSWPSPVNTLLLQSPLTVRAGRMRLRVQWRYFVCKLFSHFAHRRRVNIDLSNIPDDQPYADKAFVDSISKRYWIDK